MFRRILTAFVALTASATCLAQEATQPQIEQIEGIVAIVNDDPISFTDVRQRARLLLLSLGGQQPSQEEVQQITSQALDQLIDEKLQLQEASEYEVEISDDEIANSIENIARQSGITREILVNSLLQSGINPVSLEQQTRADIAWRRIMRGLYGSRIRISDNQINDQLNRLVASSDKRQFQLSEIFLYAPDEETKEQAMTAAQSIKSQLDAGAPFELAAQRFSSAPTAATGGDMGWVSLDDLDEARSAAINSANSQGLITPFVVEDGVYLMQIRNIREPSEKTSLVDLTRITVANQSEADMLAALEKIESCETISDVVDADENLRAVELADLNVEELGGEGKAMVLNTEVGKHTDIFAQSGTLAVMYVCGRRDDMANIPNKVQIEDTLYAQQLGMISERSLRNLRREATIIRR
ncbi:MAG: peptidylprolyl isomerase [Henriciella sp.]